MAISVDWPTGVITVPRADLAVVQLAPTEIRQLDLDAFRLDLKALEDDEAGIAYPATHAHTPPLTVGGVTLARAVELLPPYTVTFEDGQYAVNLVGANSNVADRVNVNQVSVRSANSAGLTFSETINDQSYEGGRVFIDTADGRGGTTFPRGSLTDPVDNWADADFIASARNLHSFDMRGALAFAPGDTLQGTSWYGPSPLQATLVLSGQSTAGAVFQQLAIIGALNGRSSFKTCSFSSLCCFSGIAEKCTIQDTLELDANAIDDMLLFNCLSGVPGSNRPVLDVNGTAADVGVRQWSGGLRITNATAGNAISIDATAGTVEIDASCTDADIVIRGNVSLIDNSNGATVTDATAQALTWDATL